MPKMIERGFDRPLLLDGGLGGTLEDEYNIVFSSKTPLWSSDLLVNSPETLLDAQRGFARAGADVIITATYQASLEGFRNTKTNRHPTGIGRKDAEDYMRSAVTIARSAFENRSGLVALSLGAYGATMVPSTEYSGEYGSLTEADLIDFHQERLDIFQKDHETWSKIDMIAFETIPRLNEVHAIQTVMQKPFEKPYWISCVFPNDDHLPDGSSIEMVLQATLGTDRKPFAIGVNCTQVHLTAILILKFEEAAQKLNLQLPKVVMYPNGAGNKVYDTTIQKWTGDDTDSKPWDQEVFEIVQGIQDRGRWEGVLVGGCCKTTSKHILNLRNRLDRDKEKQ